MPGAAYYWRVSASNVDYPLPDFNRVFWNGVIPSPTNLFTSHGDSTTPVTLYAAYEGIMLNWTAPSPAPYAYDVQFSYTSNFSTILMEGTSSDPWLFYWADSFPMEGKVYWRARSVYDRGPAGVGEWTSSKSFTLDFTPPPVPVVKTPATGAVLATTRPTFSWNASTGAASYTLYVSEAQTGIPVVGFPKTVTTTSYTIPSTAAHLYQSAPDGFVWFVVAMDAAGNGSAGSPESFFTVFSGLTPTEGQTLTDTTPRFTWQGVSGTGAAPWRVLISTTPDMSNVVYTSPDLAATSTAFTLPNASALSTGVYYWLVIRSTESAIGVPGRELIITTP